MPTLSLTTRILTALVLTIAAAETVGTLRGGGRSGATCAHAREDASPSLKGRVLVADPDMPDPTFQGTLVLLLAHDARGAVGLVFNRPSAAAGVLDELALPLYDGGPVGDETLLVLHDDANAPGALQVTDGLFVSSSEVMVPRLLDGRGPAHAKVTWGYAGWGPGQLDRELQEPGVWHVETMTAADVLAPR